MKDVQARWVLAQQEPGLQWWSEEVDKEGRRIVATFMDAIKGVNKDVIDVAEAFTDGRQIIILVGETHSDASPEEARVLTKALSDIRNKSTVYVEQPEHPHSKCFDGNSPVGLICRLGRVHKVHKIDLRVDALYDIKWVLKEELELERGSRDRLHYLLKSYCDMLTLYSSNVETRVHLNVTKTTAADPRFVKKYQLLKDELKSFLQGIHFGIHSMHKQIQAIDRLIHTGGSGSRIRDELRGLLNRWDKFVFPLTCGLDIHFLSDVFRRNRQISILFTGSAHVRRMHDVLLSQQEYRWEKLDFGY